MTDDASSLLNLVNTAKAAAVTPAYITATRWRKFLLSTSPSFRALTEERERGWKSTALDSWYASRAPRSTTGTGSTEKNSGATSHRTTTGSSFSTADIETLTERYRQHAKRVLTDASARFFSPEPSRTFLDLGCAPGGVSCFLTKDLHWSGVGVTLSPESSGIATVESLLEMQKQGHCGGERHFALVYGDVTEAESTWRASCDSSSSQSVASDAVTLESRFDFVNGGAVQDHGQRLLAAKRSATALMPAAVSESDRICAVDEVQCLKQARTEFSGSSKETDQQHDFSANSNTERGDEQDCLPFEGESDSAVLPWFTLLVPQLRLALRHVKQGGSLMLVHGAPQCASLFILMERMEVLLETTAATPGGAAAAADVVHMVETMHLGKTPVYVLWEGVCTDGKEEEAARLVESLSPPSHATSLKEAASMLAEQRRFWLGESEEGFAVAQRAFYKYRSGVEQVWQKMKEFLEKRRLRAERAMTMQQRQRQPIVQRR